MMNQQERLIQRRNTREFIKADSITVRLNRQPDISNGAGGVMPGTLKILDSQVFRLVPATLSVFANIKNKIEGQVPSESWALIGMPDADIQIKDTFVYQGDKYEVISISTDREYRIAAGVVNRGANG